MAVVLPIAALAAAVWGAWAAHRASLWPAVAVVVACGYVLGPPLWSAHAGPLPITVDRVLMAGLAGMMLWHWRLGRAKLPTLTAADWLLAGVLAYFTLRYLATPAAPPGAGSSVKPLWKLVAAFWAPAALYAASRMAPPSERASRSALTILAALGLFLALTAYAEIFKQWWAVFPRYVANPELGTHFGRARGPALNSASLGVFLSICFWAAWLRWPGSSRWMQGGLIAALALIAGAVYLTYTRSTWIGLAAGLAIIPLCQLPRRWRLPAALALALAGVLALGAVGANLADLKRKDADASAEHSVYQRASFVYVSMRMFRDAPVLGCGLGRFYDCKIPYLADRSQHLELESLRSLDHHNTLLSVLVETGLVGFMLFVGLLAAWTVAAWRLAFDVARPAWQRRQGLFALATMLTYLSSAVFHDLTLSPTEHWLLFFAAGAALAVQADPRGARKTCLAEPRRMSIPTATPALVPGV